VDDSMTETMSLDRRKQDRIYVVQPPATRAAPRRIVGERARPLPEKQGQGSFVMRLAWASPPIA
jgi:hypothetical protein